MVNPTISQSGKHGPGETVYERYLHTEELLSLQKAEDQLVHHDELQFQVVHQVFELWWKESAFELRTISALLKQNDLAYALRLLQRVVRTQHLMLENLRMLETMTPWEFHEFRKILADGAGTDSPGFHLLMRLSPSLWEDYQTALEREHVTLVDVYMHGERYPLLLAIAEALTDYDEVFQMFRAHHVKLAQRMIGPASVGTGGTPMTVLERTLKDSFYPALWEVRNKLTQIANSSETDQGMA